MTSPEFPNYQQQVSMPEHSGIPLGVPVVDPKYNKPLMKIMKKMMKPSKLPKMRTGRVKKKKIV